MVNVCIDFESNDLLLFFRPDCIQILKKCSNSSFHLASLSRKVSPEEVCDEYSPPDKKAPCISLKEYLGKYKGLVEVLVIKCC